MGSGPERVFHAARRSHQWHHPRAWSGAITSSIWARQRPFFRIQEQIPRETYRRGDRVKAMLLEVRRTPKDVQVILSRSHPQFVSKLFEVEVPEIMEKIVEIKARRAGAWRSHEDRRHLPRKGRGSGRRLRGNQRLACPGGRSRVARRENRYYYVDLGSARLHRRSIKSRHDRKGRHRRREKVRAGRRGGFPTCRWRSERTVKMCGWRPA